MALNLINIYWSRNTKEIKGYICGDVVGCGLTKTSFHVKGFITGYTLTNAKEVVLNVLNIHEMEVR